MCGLVGFVGGGEAVRAAGGLETVCAGMADTLAHRGPDDAGVWTDAAAGVALGHRRLAILDLSPAGHQPMASASGRWVIAFNGEIYNHAELRARVLGAEGSGAGGGRVATWRGHSDTETLLAACERFGVVETLQACVGMFALALWDRRTRTLTLARDRFGEKPLYYGRVGDALVFGSELKALRAFPGFANPICREALYRYLQRLYVPAPLTIYDGIRKLEPGTWLEVPVAGGGAGAAWRNGRYWSLAAAVEAGGRAPIADEGEALERLEAQLREAVRLQSLADVPLGAFLSGGVDSATIVALMQQESARPVRTFTVGFDEAGFDEAAHALGVARHLGTEHTELRVTAAEAREAIPLLPTLYDEPFADSSQIPTWLICRAGRREVTVALSGDAGDELFGGYNRYFWGPRLWQRLAWWPLSLQRALGRSLRAVSPARWDRLGDLLNRRWAGAAGVVRLGDKAHKFAARLGQFRDLDGLYASLVTEWTVPPLVPGIGPAALAVLDSFPPVSGRLLAPEERMMFLDALSYLPDDILCKLDRAAMAVGLETRVPFLDHRVVELAWRLPLRMKIRDHTGKWLLRRLLDRYVPRTLIERPKAGFAIPVGDWLRGPLRDWAETLLTEGRLRQEGFFDPAPIRAAWAEHLSGRCDWTGRLWSVLMFQAWLEGQVSGDSMRKQ